MDILASKRCLFWFALTVGTDRLEVACRTGSDRVLEICGRHQHKCVRMLANIPNLLARKDVFARMS